MAIFKALDFRKESVYKPGIHDMSEQSRVEEDFIIQANEVVRAGIKEEVLTIPAPAPSSVGYDLDTLFNTQDSLRTRIKTLKKFVLTVVPASEDRSQGLVKLDEALASFVVGLTKEMR